MACITILALLLFYYKRKKTIQPAVGDIGKDEIRDAGQPDSHEIVGIHGTIQDSESKDLNPEMPSGKVKENECKVVHEISLDKKSAHPEPDQTVRSDSEHDQVQNSEAQYSDWGF